MKWNFGDPSKPTKIVHTHNNEQLIRQFKCWNSRPYPLLYLVAVYLTTLALQGADSPGSKLCRCLTFISWLLSVSPLQNRRSYVNSLIPYHRCIILLSTHYFTRYDRLATLLVLLFDPANLTLLTTAEVITQVNQKRPWDGCHHY
jgi:hypothetical protein